MRVVDDAATDPAPNRAGWIDDDGATPRSVSAAYFFALAGIGVWIPYMPLYLGSLGFGGAQVGALLGLNPAIRWTAAIGWAYAADALRIRHRLFVVAAIGSATCMAAMLLTDHLATVAAAFAAIAFFGAPLVPMMDAMVLDHLPRLGGDYGRIRAWGSVGFIVGSLVAAAVIARSSPAVVPALLLVFQAALPFASRGLPRGQHGHAEHFRAPWRLLSPPMNAFLLTSFLSQLSNGAWAGFFAAYTRSRGLPDWLPGVTWGLAVVTEVATLLVGRRLFARFAPADVVIGVLLLSAVRFALTALVHRPLPVILVQLAYGPSFAGFHLAAQLVLGRLVPARSSTNGQALYGFVSFGLGSSLGFALAGALVDRIGPSALFAVEAALSLAAVLPALWLRRLLRRATGTGTAAGTPPAGPGGTGSPGWSERDRTRRGAGAPRARPAPEPEGRQG